jgi:hypothetical protein
MSVPSDKRTAVHGAGHVRIGGMAAPVVAEAAEEDQQASKTRGVEYGGGVGSRRLKVAEPHRSQAADQEVVAQPVTAKPRLVA